MPLPDKKTPPKKEATKATEKVPYSPPIAEAKIVETYFGDRGTAILREQWGDARFLEKLANELLYTIESEESAARWYRSKYASLDNLDFAPKVFQTDMVKYRNILIKHAELAFAKNMDLNISSWKEHLLSILRNPSIITVYPIILSEQTADGFSYKKCEVDINIEALAGNISDYVTAVRYAREVLNYGKQFKGSIGTRMWYTRLWMSGRTPGGHYRLGVFRRTTARSSYIDTNGQRRSIPITTSSVRIGSKPNDNLEAKHAEFYWSIMNARMQSMGKKAPYWYLLNYGATSMKGDQGGYAAPPISPTWFVEKAKAEIAALAYNSLENEINTSNSSNMESAWYAEGTADKVRNVVAALKVIIADLTSTGTYQASLDIAMRYLRTTWAPLLAQLEKDANTKERVKMKMELLANKIIAEMETGPRLYLKTVAGKEVRPRTTALVREIKKQIHITSPTYRTPRVVVLEAQKQTELIQAKIDLAKRLRVTKVSRKS
jgi:hypothetical protein